MTRRQECEWSPRKVGFWTESTEKAQERLDAIEDPMEQHRMCMDALMRQIRGERLYPAPVEVAPIQLKEANDFLRHHHRHSRPVRGWKFGMALQDHLSLVGVAVVGRPVARKLDDGQTLEVTRLCVLGGEVHNLASRLLGACGRAAKEMGYSRLITYTHADESGASLRAAGYEAVATTRGGSWSRAKRAREDYEQEQGLKTRWEKWIGPKKEVNR